MQSIDVQRVQEALDRFAAKPLYLHLETTQGAYASRENAAILNAGAFIRNGKIQYTHGKLTGNGPYRVGLKLDLGWVYAEGLTDYEIDEAGRLLLAGHDQTGRLAVALQLSLKPF